MSEKPFIVNDRRKFTSDGTLRPDSERAPVPAEPAPAAAETAPPPPPEPAPASDAPPIPPPPTAEEKEQSTTAYNALVDHLDTAVRAADPSRGPIPPVSFSTIIHSVYMNAVVQLGLAAPEGQRPRADLLGARQSIDMLAVLAEKTKGNLTEDESKLLETVLFELRLTFIEVTQAISRAAQQSGGKTPPVPGAGPSIVS